MKGKIKLFCFLLLSLIIANPSMAWKSKFFDKSNKKKSYLSARMKKKYKEIDYEKLLIAPRRFRGKSIKFHFTYHGPASYTSYSYKEKLSTDRYFYFDTGECESKLPILYHRKTRKRITDKLMDLPKGSDVIIYGKIRTLPKGYYDCYKGRKYYFYVDDLEIPGEDDSEGTGKIVISSYTPVDVKNLDLLANQYLNKKIRIKMKYSGRIPEIGSPLNKTFREDTFFQLSSGLRDNNPLAGFALIGKKTNTKLVRKVISLKEGETIYLYGTLKKMVDKYACKKVSYYILIDAINKVSESGDSKDFKF